MKPSGNITITSVFCERGSPAVMSKKIDSVAAGPLHLVYLSPRAFSAAVTCLRPRLCLTLSFFSSWLLLCFLVPFAIPNRPVQPTSLLGGLQAAPAVQRGPERGQPQSAAILPSPPGAPVRPHCLRGKEALRIMQVRIFQSMQRHRRASGLMERKLAARCYDSYM